VTNASGKGPKGLRQGVGDSNSGPPPEGVPGCGLMALLTWRSARPLRPPMPVALPPLPNGRVPTVYQKWARETLRLLRPGGRLALTSWQPRELEGPAIAEPSAHGLGPDPAPGGPCRGGGGGSARVA
jgi:hypothetical protein